MLRGYIDESFNRDLFNLSCLVSADGTWFWFVLDWLKWLGGKNASLKAQGRRQLSRYKAADCSSLVGEFAGWTKHEQIEFTQGLLGVFRRHPLHIISYSLNLAELIKEIPETKPNPVGFAYVLLLNFLMIEIGDYTLKKQPSAISLVHDRCNYDAALLEAFDHLMDDLNFEYRESFTTISPMSWEHCVPLQPADLIAYENFKDAERRLKKKSRMRKTLELLLELDSIGGRAKGFDEMSLRELKRIMDDLNEETKEVLMLNARIRKKRNS